MPDKVSYKNIKDFMAILAEKHNIGCEQKGINNKPNIYETLEKFGVVVKPYAKRKHS